MLTVAAAALMAATALAACDEPAYASARPLAATGAPLCDTIGCMSDVGHSVNGWPVTVQPKTKGANQDIRMPMDAKACGGTGRVQDNCPLIGDLAAKNAHYYHDPIVTLYLPAIGKCLAAANGFGDSNVTVEPCTGVTGVDYIAHMANTGGDGGVYLVAIATSNEDNGELGVWEVTSGITDGAAVYVYNGNVIPTWGPSL